MAERLAALVRTRLPTTNEAECSDSSMASPVRATRLALACDCAILAYEWSPKIPAACTEVPYEARENRCWPALRVGTPASGTFMPHRVFMHNQRSDGRPVSDIHDRHVTHQAVGEWNVQFGRIHCRVHGRTPGRQLETTMVDMFMSGVDSRAASHRLHRAPSQSKRLNLATCEHERSFALMLGYSRLILFTMCAYVPTSMPARLPALFSANK